MRSWRSELLTVSMVLAVPAYVIAVFPYGAMGFRSASDRGNPSVRSLIVRLSEQEEALALKAAKSSWRGDVRFALHRVDLSFGSLPDDGMAVEVLPIEDRGHEPDFGYSEPGMPVFVPSQAAPRPLKIAPLDLQAPRPAFTREDLLNID